MKFSLRTAITCSAIYLLVVMSFIALFARVISSNDFIETIAISRWKDLSLAYHPPVTFLITRLLDKALPSHLILEACYVSVYIVVTILVIAAWRFSKEFFAEPKLRFISTMCFMFCMFFRKNVNFSPDLFQLLFGTLAIIYSYYVLKYGQTKYWILLTIFTILTFFTKYQAGLLIACMGVPFLLTTEGRERLRSKEFVFSSLIFLSLVGVYFYYNFESSPLNYLLNYEDSKSSSLSQGRLILRVLITPFKLIFFKYYYIGLIVLLLFCRKYNVKDIRSSYGNFVERLKTKELEEVFIFGNFVVFILAFSFISFFQYLESRIAFSSALMISIGSTYFFKLLFDKMDNIDFRCKSFRYLYGILIILVPFVMGVDYIYKNRTDLKQLYKTTVRKIEDRVPGEIEYVIVQHQSDDLQNLYSHFSDNPKIKMMVHGKTDVHSKTGTEKFFLEQLKDKNFVLVWERKEEVESGLEVPKWATKIIEHFPGSKISEPVDLKSEQRKILAFPLKTYEHSFQYAYRIL